MQELKQGDVLKITGSSTAGDVGDVVVEKELGLYYNDLRYQPLDNRELAILKSFPNVLFTPHMAFYTEEAIRDMVYHSLESYLAFLEQKES